MQPNRISLILGLAAVAFLGFFMAACQKYPNCKNDQQCEGYGTGENYCVDRICRECIDDSACGTCQRCSGNACVAIPGCCSDSSDCNAPQVCRDGRCGAECLSDSECGDRERCQAGSCIEAACTNDDHCAEGQRCNNYRCEDIVETSTEPCANRQFRTIYFDFDESRLRADQADAANENLTCLGLYQGNITIEGHCDERGTAEYNVALGERRARTIRDWLMRNGVPRARLQVISRGAYYPAAQGHNENAWRQNRRVETIWR